MSDFDEMKLRRLDLTLLLIFLGLMKRRKAIEVAADMGLTQSSISHALGRLRDIFGDPLFLRQPHGFEPTAFALDMEPRIRVVVETLSDTLSGPAAFDPSNAKGVFRIGAYDSELAVLIPGLLRRIGQLAPHVQLVTQSISRHQAMAAMDDHQLDMAIGFFWNVADSFVDVPLYEEDYVLACRAGHPIAANNNVSMEAYLACSHLVVSPAGDLHGVVDDTLNVMGLERHVRIAVPQFFPALVILSQSDMIASLPRQIASRYAAHFDLSLTEVPIQVRSFAVSCRYHERNSRDPRHIWFLEQLKAEVSMITA